MLNPYFQTSNINGALQSGMVIKSAYETDSLDKRTATKNESRRNSATQIVDTVQALSDSIGNLAGSRSPMYIIGQIDGYDDEATWWLPDQVSGLIRATANMLGSVKQEGVIIDGIGDVDGNFSVELTKNPVYFVGSNVSDHRYRVPATLRMTVMVSNYLSDSITDATLNAISALDPTGILANYTNNLSYGGNTRSQYALLKLRSLMETAQPFTVYTPHGIYENMVIKSLKPTTDSGKMDMLYCDIEFQEIIFYTPYSNDPGKMPARKGVDSVREGWTNNAIGAIKNLSISGGAA